MEISLKQLTYRYGGKKATPALDGINAEVGTGIHLLLGENGAGKTTLLHLIDGLLTPSEGKCLINGGPTGNRLPSVLSKVFYLGAGMPLPAVSIAQMVKIHASFYPTFSADTLQQSLADFGIDPNDRLSKMSMGTRQKAAVAYALALHTPILLLDEPATGLDIQSKQKLQTMLARCTEPDQTVIISTHNIADLQNLYDSLMVLRHGRLLMAAGIDHILERIAFVNSVNADGSDALYSAQRLGTTRCIVANDGSLETDIDFQLLYLALNDPAASAAILNRLK